MEGQPPVMISRPGQKKQVSYRFSCHPVCIDAWPASERGERLVTYLGGRVLAITALAPPMFSRAGLMSDAARGTSSGSGFALAAVNIFASIGG